MALKIGKKAPEFCLKAHNEQEWCLKDNLGKWLIIYFYPKDNTPHCTTEAVDFTKEKKGFDKLEAEIIGISPDSVRSHKNFMNKYNLNLTLLCDEEQEVMDLYNVLKLKKIFGQNKQSVLRTTFLLNPKGEIEQIWNNVCVDGHVEEVKEKLKSLK